MFDAVFSGVWQAFGVDREELIGPTRNRFVSRARFAASIVLRENGATLAQIGGMFRRDQSTISVGIETGLRIAGEHIGPPERICPEFSARLNYLRSLTREALQAEKDAAPCHGARKDKRPPAANVGRPRDEPIETALTRASIEAASVRLGQLLALERGGEA